MTSREQCTEFVQHTLENSLPGTPQWLLALAIRQILDDNTLLKIEVEDLKIFLNMQHKGDASGQLKGP